MVRASYAENSAAPAAAGGAAAAVASASVAFPDVQFRYEDARPLCVDSRFAALHHGKHE